MNTNTDQAKWQIRRDVLISIICIGIIIWIVWSLINQFIEAILLLLLAMTVTYLITPLVNALETRQHIPRIVAAILTYIIVLSVFSLLAYLLVSSLVSQLGVFSKTISAFTASIPSQYSTTINFLKTRLDIPQTRIDAAINQFGSQVSGIANTAINNIINIAFLLTNTVIDTLIVIIISFYLTLDGKRMRNSIMNIVPKRSTSSVLLFEDALTSVVGRYIRGQLTLAVIIGLLTALVCTIFGLQQFAIIFGVLGFLFETIPMVGPFLASITPILTSLLLPNPFPRTIFIIVCFIVIQIIESNILGPRIVGKAVGLHPVVSIIALLVFTRLFGTAFGAFGGAIGALIATPIVAAIWVVISSIYRSFHGESPEQIRTQKSAPWTMPRRPSFTTVRHPRSGQLQEHAQREEKTKTSAATESAATPEQTKETDQQAVQKDIQEQARNVPREGR